MYADNRAKFSLIVGEGARGRSTNHRLGIWKHIFIGRWGNFHPWAFPSFIQVKPQLTSATASGCPALSRRLDQGSSNCISAILQLPKLKVWGFFPRPVQIRGKDKYSSQMGKILLVGIQLIVLLLSYACVYYTSVCIYMSIFTYIYTHTMSLKTPF